MKSRFPHIIRQVWKSQILCALLSLTQLMMIGQCANDNTYWIDLTPPGPGLSATTACIWGGEYVTVNVVTGNSYNFSTCGSFFDTQITLINSGTGLSVGYNDDGCGLQSTVNWVATFTGVLWVLVDQYYCSDGFLCSTLSATQLGAPPANDGCATATPIVCGASAVGNTASASPDAVPAGCGNATSNSVWYSFVGTGQLVNVSLCGSSYDTQLSILTGPCGALSCVAFNDDDQNFICGLQSDLFFSALAGVTYYIRVSGFGAQSGAFELNINLCVTESGNDPCSGAYPIACGQTITGTTVGMNIDDIPNGCGFEYSPGVWYQFVGNGDNVTMSLCGSTFDTQLSIFTGICNALICQDTNDDFAACGTESEITFLGVAGVTYYVYVFGLPPSEGNFTLNMSCAPFTPTPQDCTGSLPICGDTQFNGNSSGDGDVIDLDAGNQGCLIGNEHQSSWYYFSPLTTGTISFTINPIPIVDYDFAVWGPFPALQCPIVTPPLRCSFSALYAPTGLGNGALDVSESAGGNAWVAPIIVGAAEVNQIYIMCLDNFSSTTTPFIFDWSLAGVTLNCQLLLPIELGSLEGQPLGSSNLIKWTTITEWMNERFVVERSLDGIHFEAIGSLPGAIESHTPIQYSFTDNSPNALTCYYRLKQEDTNGKVSYTHSISITRNTRFILAPNPADHLLNVTSASAEIGQLKLCLYNSNGSCAKCVVINSGVDKNTTSLNISDMPSGLYQILIFSNSGEKIFSDKLLVEH